MYVDYGYYADQYGGGITEKEFPSAERKAEAYIRKLTYIRGNIFATEDMAVKDAVCAVADVYHSCEKKKEAGAVKSENNDIPIVGNITGPISTASSLMEPVDFYKELRKKNKEAHEFMDFVKRLSEESEKVCIIEMPAFDSSMSKHVDFCIKDSDVNKVIVYDDELKIKSMEQYLFKLQTKDHIEISFMEDYDMANNQPLKLQEMVLN